MSAGVPVKVGTGSAVGHADQVNVPKLRFPEFMGAWEEKRLGSVAGAIGSGKSSHSYSGAVPVHGSTGQIGWSAKADYNGPAILVARVGANAGKMNQVSGSYGVTDNTLILPIEDGTDQIFVFDLLIKTNLNRFVFGSGQPLITGTMLKSLKCYFPPLPEQQKIAAFLGAWMPGLRRWGPGRRRWGGSRPG